MARKKKTKAKPKKAAVDESVEPDAAEEEAGSTPKKRRAAKKKRARKKSEKKAGGAKAKKAEKDAPPAEEVEAIVTALDDAGSGERETIEAVVGSEAEDDELEVEDLDAVLDGELEGPEDLHELIAATVAGAQPEGHPEEPTVQPLDEEPVEVAVEASLDAIPAEDLLEEVVEPPPSEELAPSTEEELAGTIDLGPVSTPELRDRLLAQALAHSELQDARYRVPFSDPRRTGRWKGAVAALLLLVAGIVAVAPPAWVRPAPPAEIDEAARLRDIRVGLLLQAQQVEAYRVRWQRLPNVLDDVSGRLPGIRFVRSGNRIYQLIAYAPDGSAIVYDSTDPAPEFERLTPAWLPGEGQ